MYTHDVNIHRYHPVYSIMMYHAYFSNMCYTQLVVSLETWPSIIDIY